MLRKKREHGCEVCICDFQHLTTMQMHAGISQGMSVVGSKPPWNISGRRFLLSPASQGEDSWEIQGRFLWSSALRLISIKQRSSVMGANHTSPTARHKIYGCRHDAQHGSSCDAQHGSSCDAQHGSSCDALHNVMRNIISHVMRNII